MSHKKYLTILLIIFFAVLVWSGIKPSDYYTWMLEVFPAVIGLIVLAVTYKKFRFSDLLYALMLFHAIILMVGGHTTYAEMPLFNWFKDIFDLERNYYDRLGHFVQGFVPVLVIRELIIRKNLISTPGWTSFFAIATTMALSVLYEFIEWWTALASGSAADAFLGTQGDVWDTQWDMFMCLIGALTAIFIFGRFHDKEINKIKD